MRDNIQRKSRPGEKRIYSVNIEDGTVSNEIYLRNDGIIEITGGNLNIFVNGDANIKATNVNVDAAVTNLGVGGKNIARLGDEITVEVTSGSSAGTYKGTITSSGVNTSI